MSHPDPRSVLRLAIALTAQKHKPRDQSFTSYLLDLQSHFPLTTERNDSESRDWRTYALELEKQLAVLKAQRDADQELLSKFPTDASQTASASDAPPPKKKIKKNHTKDQHDPEWSWDRSRADWSRFLSSQYPSAPSLVVAYASLKGALAAPDADLLLFASRLSHAILRALDTIHLFLFSSPDSQTQAALGTPSQSIPEHIDSTRIALASPLLVYVLRTALHTLVRTAQDSAKPKRLRDLRPASTLASTDAHAHVDQVIDGLFECILLPLLRALFPLCSARFAHLVLAPPKKGKASQAAVTKGKDKSKNKGKDKHASSASVDPPKKTDVRTDVFALISTSIEALDALPLPDLPSGPSPSADGSGVGTGSIAGSVRDRLGLETIRELEALYTVPPPTAVPPPSSLKPSSQPPATPSEPPLPTPTPTPLSAPPPPPSQPLAEPQTQTQPQRRAVLESRAERLERLAGTRAERVRALATRDAGWFLVSTLNLCVSPPLGAAARCHGAPAAGSLGGILRDALLDRVGKLVRSVPLGGLAGSVSESEGQQPSDAESKFAIDPVCQNMLLAVCERAMGHLAS